MWESKNSILKVILKKVGRGYGRVDCIRQIQNMTE